MAKEQFPTLMIKDMLGELASEVEATEAQSSKEEEGSSSTPAKEDNESLKQ